MPNRLAEEKSPYLLQHANNPVDWYPWGPAAFEKARAEDKPIFLSVGYSTCHWCHVMERESFESTEVAEVLNRDFVPVKVDREERPDVDRIYMTFVQATTQSGGWPMSVFLTPDLKPFFGGTYFPPDNRYGRPGFRALLEYLSNAWKNDRQRILKSSSDVIRQLQKFTDQGSAGGAFNSGVLDSAFFEFRRSFDSKLGGFGGAPKFPRPVVHNFLLRYGQKHKNQEAIDMVLATLRHMARGGINDQLGGGFHRYSVDERWFVPHFEKMLYDQAQLATSYLEAFQITRDEFFAGVARDIFEYVLRDLTSPEGGFYSAEDADSVIDPADPHEKGEGAFYIWSADEIEQLLGPDAYLFAFVYGVSRSGNVQHDPQGEFTGRNILHEMNTPEEAAEEFKLSPEEVRAKLADARARLLEARSGRIRPHLDDKVLTAWNGLMISAFAKGAQILDEPRYHDAARRAADFIRTRLYSAGTLLRRYRDGEAAVPGFLDDYAFYVQALIDLYETGFDPADLTLARELAQRMITLFNDPVRGAFFSTAENSPDLVLRMKEEYDGAEPSGNSIAALALLRLAQMMSDVDLARAASAVLEGMAPRVTGSPGIAPQMLVAYLFERTTPRQIILSGEPDSPDTPAFLRAIRSKFLPNQVVLLASASSREQLGQWNPVIEQMTERGGRTTAYVCENFACRNPTSDLAEFESLLQ